MQVYLKSNIHSLFGAYYLYNIIIPQMNVLYDDETGAMSSYRRRKSTGDNDMFTYGRIRVNLNEANCRLLCDQTLFFKIFDNSPWWNLLAIISTSAAQQIYNILFFSLFR